MGPKAMKPGRLTAWLGAIVLAASTVMLPSQASAVCDRAPHDQNPAAVMPEAFSPVAAAVNRNFSEVAGSQRWYDLVEGLDGVTLGFGNWPQQEVAGFFSDMASAKGGTALTALEICLADHFASDAAAWRALRRTAGWPDAEPTVAAVNEALRRTVLSPVFMARYRRHCAIKCKAGEPNFFAEQGGWFTPAMHDAFRDRVVIAWQVDFWSRTIVADAIDAVVQLGLARGDEPAVVATAAYISSSPGWLVDLKRASRGDGVVRFNGRVWNWNRAPAGLEGSDWLRRWRLLVLWQVYSNHVQVVQLRRKGSWSFRDRSRSFWTDYLSTWWKLPAVDRYGRPDWRSDENLQPDRVVPIAAATAAG